MSSRVLRKLQGDGQLDLQPEEEDDEDEVNIVQSKRKKKKNLAVNPFDLVQAKKCSTVT